MDLEELRSVRRTERQKDSLQHLRDSFYEDVAAYIEERKAERKRAAAAADDPFGDPRVGELTDEIETAEDVVEAIYERRVGKVVKLASFAAADMSADTDGLTAEERDLFDDLVGRIKQNRRAVLDVLAGEGDADVADTPAVDTPAAVEDDARGTDAPAPSGGTDSETPPAARAPESTSTDGATPAEGGSATPPDDVFAEAMGGSDAPSDPAAEAGDGGPRTSTSPDSETATAAESAASSTDADDGGEPTVPPDAPPEATPTEAPVVGEQSGEDSAADGQSTSDSNRTARDGGVPEPGEATGPAGGDRGGSHDRDDTERVTLRITEDVGQIFGVDEREYDLASEDVVTLPSTNAGPLLDRDAAERLE